MRHVPRGKPIADLAPVTVDDWVTRLSRSRLKESPVEIFSFRMARLLPPTASPVLPDQGDRGRSPASLAQFEKGKDFPAILLTRRVRDRSPCKSLLPSRERHGTFLHVRRMSLSIHEARLALRRRLPQPLKAKAQRHLPCPSGAYGRNCGGETSTSTRSRFGRITLIGKKRMHSFAFSLVLIALLCCGGCAKDDSNVRPPVTQTDLLIVRRADQILSSEEVWNRADDRVYRPDATTFSLYTALAKATLEVGGKFGHREAVMQEARFAIEEIAPRKQYAHRLMGYNNDPTTTFPDIKRVLALTEARITKRLQSEK